MSRHSRPRWQRSAKSWRLQDSRSDEYCTNTVRYCALGMASAFPCVQTIAMDPGATSWS
jgi:hypothetical protein